MTAKTKPKKEWSFIQENKQRGNWQFIFTDKTGKRKSKSFPNESQAKKAKKAHDKADKEAAVKASTWDTASSDQKRNFHDLNKFAVENGFDLWDAARHYLKFITTSSIDLIKVEKAVPLCLEAKENEDGVSNRYLQSLRSVLNRFAFKCGKLVVNEVRHPQITEFLKGYKISLRTRQGYLTDLRSFFSWCEQKGYCEINPCVAAMPSKAKRKQIMEAKRGRRKLQVLTPAEVKKLLTYCETEEPTLTPYACLCVFGGLRPEREAPNMIDGDITAEAITVPEEFAKDNETRIIEPLSPNFIKWINHIKRREGSFQKVANLKRKWIKAKKSIGRDWPHDCLRHSYASYHFAEYNDAGLTAKNLGHPDSTLLRKDYNGAVTKAQAKAFWAILPTHCR